MEPHSKFEKILKVLFGISWKILKKSKANFKNSIKNIGKNLKGCKKCFKNCWNILVKF